MSQRWRIPEQMEHFDKEIVIVVEIGDTAQPGFTIDFKGEIIFHYAVYLSKSNL